MMKKTCALLLAILMIFSLFACGASTPAASPSPSASTAPSSAAPTSAAPASSGEKPSIGFVTMGLGGEFFQALADAYQKTFTDAGWDATYVDGKMDINTQIEACENYIAKKVDVLVLWALQGKALSQVAEQAMAAGVKVVSFVELTDKYDVAMRSDNATFGYTCDKLAAQWVDKTFPDAAPGSVTCVVVYYDMNTTVKEISDTLMDIEKINPKVHIIEKYSVTNEDTATGVAAAENIFAKYPDVNLILTESGQQAIGVNNYLTSLASPIKDFSKLGIFSMNGSSDVAFKAIKDSANNTSALRGLVVSAGISATLVDLMTAAKGALDGSLEKGYTMYAKNELLNADTIDEFLKDGTVTSLLPQDLPYKAPNE